MKYGNEYWCELKEDGMLPVKIFRKTFYGNNIEVATAVDSIQARLIIRSLEEHIWDEEEIKSGG